MVLDYGVEVNDQPEEETSTEFEVDLNVNAVCFGCIFLNHSCAPNMFTQPIYQNYLANNYYEWVFCGRKYCRRNRIMLWLHCWERCRKSFPVRELVRIVCCDPLKLHLLNGYIASVIVF